MSDKFKVKNGLNLPDTTTAEQGDVVMDATAGIQFYHNGAERTVADLNSTQTLTGKTLSGNIATNLVSGAATLTLPTSTDTLVGRATTDTLTNKTLTAPVISTISNTGTVTLPTATCTLMGKDTTDTMTNKTFDADGTGNSITNIENADIKAAAAIAVNKLAALTASRIVQTDGSGFISHVDTATYPTLTELSYVKGVTSAVQTQLDSKTGITATTAAKTGNYTATTSDVVIPVDATSGSFTVTLYAASGNSGRRLTIVRTDQTLANAVTIDGNASETIRGATTFKLATQYESVTIICDGSNWHIEQHNIPSIWTTFTMSITGSTSNPTKGTASTDAAYWRRVGDSMEIQYTYIHTTVGSGAAGSGRYRFTIPGSLTADTGKITAISGSNGGPNIGSANVNGTAPGSLNGQCELETTTGIAIFCPTSADHVGSALAPLNGAVAKYSFSAKVPITGWEG